MLFFTLIGQQPVETCPRSIQKIHNRLLQFQYVSFNILIMGKIDFPISLLNLDIRHLSWAVISFFMRGKGVIQ